MKSINMIRNENSYWEVCWYRDQLRLGKVRDKISWVW